MIEEHTLSRSHDSEVADSVTVGHDDFSLINQERNPPGSHLAVDVNTQQPEAHSVSRGELVR